MSVNSLLEGRYERKCVKTWADLEKVINDLRPRSGVPWKPPANTREWVFRGVSDSKYGLQTSLERAITKLWLDKSDWPQGCCPGHKEADSSRVRKLLESTFCEKQRTAQDIEGGLLRYFKRHYCTHGLNAPEEGETMEWLALMRHYRAPSRLLDWNYSFYIALFFAVEGADGESAVWAINSDWLHQTCLKNRNSEAWGALEDDPYVRSETFRSVFGGGQKLVAVINPRLLNVRLSRQQGVFLCPGNVTAPFEDNLAYQLEGVGDSKKMFKKIIIDGQAGFRREILERLARMGISLSSLFPDLEGFARSLEHLVATPFMLKPDPDWPQLSVHTPLERPRICQRDPGDGHGGLQRP